MITSRALARKFGVRAGLVLLLVSVIFVGSMVVNPSQLGTQGLRVSTGVDAVSESASVIQYEELSETQQSQFRSVMSENREGITAGVSGLSEYDYVFLDGKYYSLEEGQLTTFGERLLFIVLSVSFSLMVIFSGLVGITTISSGIALILSLFGVSAEDYEAFMERLDSKLVLGSVLVLLLVVLVIAPIPLGIQQVSAEQVSNPGSDTVVNAEELSSVEQGVFYDAVAGDPVLLYSESISEYDVVKSDGEYYQISYSYPLSVTSLLLGVFIYMGLVVCLIPVLMLLTTIQKDLLGKSLIERSSEV